MGDQAERVILEAEDQVSPVVDKANAGLDSFEKKAESAHGKVIRITDQTRSSVQRLMASLEKQADTYGKSGVDRLIAQRDQLLQRYAKEPAAIDAITRSYEKMVAVEQKAAREAAATKAAKEAEEALRKQSESIKSFGERIGQFIENPLQGAKGAVGSLLSTMGPFGVGVMAGATALVGFGVAAFEAAKSLGEYGTRVKDAELRTGLTAKEVGQFGFAARAVGQDISIVERLMRGLSQAADENSREGEKARTTLQRMGIDLHTTAGEMKPTSEILVEISEGLNRLPEGLQRDAAAMDLFKRVGVEAIPFMTELNENLRIAHEQGFGPTEDDVRRFQEYQREVAVLETRWDALVRKFKESIVITVSWVGKGVDWFLNNVGTAGDEERQRREVQQARQDAEAIRAAGGYGASVSRGAHRQEIAGLERRAPEIMQNRDATMKRIEDLRAEQERLTGDFGTLQAIAPTQDELARANRASDAQREIERLQKMLADAEAVTKRNDLRAGKEEVDRIRARFFGTHEGMERAYSDAKKDVERLQKQLFEPEKPLTKAEALDLGNQLRTAESTEASRKGALDSISKGGERLREFRRQAAEFEKKGDEAELDAIGKIYFQRDQLLKQAAQVKASESEIAAIRKAADEQTAVISKKAWEEFEKYADKQAAEQSKKTLALMMPSKEQLKEWEEGFAAQERIEDIGVQEQRDELRRRAARSARMAELTAGQETPMAMSEAEKREMAARKEEAAAQQAYQIRLDLAVQLAGIEAERISKEENAAKRSVLAAQAQKDLFTEIAQAQDQLEEKEAQIQQKRQQEIQSQFDNLQKQAEKLFDVLFTKPKNFGKDLVNTIHSAVLKPVTETLGGMAANALHPIIYGADGQGGLAGIFKGSVGGKQDPVRVSTDQNTTATMQNSAVMAALTAVLAASLGVAAPSLQTRAGGAAGVLGISIPSISAPAKMNAPMGAGAYSPAPWSSSGTGFNATAMLFGGGTRSGSGAAGGGTGFSGTDDSSSGAATSGYTPAPWATGGEDWSGASAGTVTLNRAPGGTGGINPLALLFGARGSAAGANGPSGLSGIVSNLKSTNWGSFKRSPSSPTYGTDENGNDVQTGDSGGKITGVGGVAGAALGAGGMMLASAGLLGNNRGTWGGIAEGTAGGAMIGMQMGGPLGAAIGAAAGFAIGGMEMLLGIVSPAQKAHDDIKSIYNVSIPTNSGTIKQVVQIAQSQFGGDIAVAVRSPSVRQLVMLYSEATGQKMPLSATTPYAGSLVEQGGKLYQQASYQDGQAHVYASNIPTLGGIGAGSYPTPSGPNTSGGTGATYMSLNISGNDAANFMTGQFVTPQFVTDQAMAAQYSSYGRTQQSANMQLPGLTVA